MTDAGLTIKENIIWVKNQFTLGRQDYQWKHEPCLYGWKEGAAHYFQNARNISTIIESSPAVEDMTQEQLVELINKLVGDSTVWNENKPQADDLHPTMKPITLIEKQIKNSSKEGQNVLDIFGGSGTTLLACENLNRNCFMMEFDPRYAQVIIERWEEETNQKAERVDDKQERKNSRKAEETSPSKRKTKRKSEKRIAEVEGVKYEKDNNKE